MFAYVDNDNVKFKPLFTFKQRVTPSKKNALGFTKANLKAV